MHWTGDNFSSWEDLRTHVVHLLNVHLFGINQNGADICGFTGPAGEELCKRWHQVGLFNTFTRNHNYKGMPEQHPSSERWSKHTQNVIRKAMHTRYELQRDYR